MPQPFILSKIIALGLSPESFEIASYIVSISLPFTVLASKPNDLNFSQKSKDGNISSVVPSSCFLFQSIIHVMLDKFFPAQNIAASQH